MARRDWLLLPMVSMLTVGSVIVATEWMARRVFPHSRTDIYTCLSGNRSADRVLDGMHGIPSAVCEGNNRDTPMTSYHLNALGHREDTGILPKIPGTFRIVLLGSSFAFGEGVPDERTFAKLLPRELSKTLGRPIELYNAAMFGETPDVMAQHFDEALPLQPDLVLWVLTAHDLQETVPPVDVPVQRQPGPGNAAGGPQVNFTSRIWRSVRVTFARKSVARAVADLWQHGVDHISGTSSAVVLLQHLLYENEAHYLRSYLKSGDAAFLCKPLNLDWRDHLLQFREDDAQIEAATQKAHIPLIAVLLPDEAQAIMISKRSWPDGVDPYQLDENLRATVTSHGGCYAEILPLLKDISNPEQYFFQVNGHPNAQGHALIADMLVKIMAPRLAADCAH